jgi:thioredoxin
MGSDTGLGGSAGMRTAQPADDLIMDTTTQNFTRDVLEASMQVPVLVDFWAPWCGPCKQFAPTYSQMAGQYIGRVRFAKVNTEAEQQLAGRYSIRSIPTLALFKQGQEVDRVAGALPAQQLQAWLARFA